MNEKKSFILYTENYEQIRKLSAQQKANLLDAVFNFAQTGEVIEFNDVVTEITFGFIRQQMERNDEKFKEKKARNAAYYNSKKNAVKNDEEAVSENIKTNSENSEAENSENNFKTNSETENSENNIKKNSETEKISKKNSENSDSDNDNVNDNVNVNDNESESVNVNDNESESVNVNESVNDNVNESESVNENDINTGKAMPCTPPPPHTHTKAQAKTKQAYGKWSNVLLSEEEYSELKREYAVSAVKDYINRLDNYIEISGKEYKNHFAVIRSWLNQDKEKKKENPDNKSSQSASASHDTCISDKYKVLINNI